MELHRGLPVERLLDPGLLLALEERVVLERIASAQVGVEGHRAVETGIPGPELEVLPDRLGEGGLDGRRWIFEIGHSVLWRTILPDGDLGIVRRRARKCHIAHRLEATAMCDHASRC